MNTPLPRPAHPSPATPTRRHALALGLAASMGGLSTGGSARAAEPGTPAPGFKLPGLSGEVDLSAWLGQLVYVDFWASWCGPCRLSFPFMNELQQRHRAQGLQVVAINVDAKRADADRFLSANPAQFTLAFDAKGDTPRRWAVKSMPSSSLVGRDGRVLWVHRGFRDEDRTELMAKVAAALAAK